MVFCWEFFEHIKSNILRSELAKVGWETFYLERGIVWRAPYMSWGGPAVYDIVAENILRNYAELRSI